MARRLLTPLAAVLGLAALAFSLTSSAQDVSEKVEKVLNRIEERGAGGLEEGTRELETLGRAAIDDLRKGLTRASPWPRLAIARVLYLNERRDEANEALGKIVTGSKTPEARRAAASMLADLAGTDKSLASRDKRNAADSMRALAKEADDAGAQVALWRGVWLLTESIEPKRAVREILNGSTDAGVKDDAALALAEMDAFLWAKAHLKDMSSQPGDKGRLARAYLKLNLLTEDLARASGSSSKYDYRQLDEIIDKLKTFYYDESKIDEKKLIEAAARGMMSSLDPHSAYYDEKAIADLRNEGLEGHYGGIGARVAMRKDKSGNAWLTITEPIFSGPAYKAGLLSNDMITEVEGQSTANKEVNDLVKILRGEPGTPVKIKVFRRGWAKERDFSIVRREIQLETTLTRMLPGGIGYIKYTTFGDLDKELELKGHNIETDLKKLSDDGMKALVLDLRGNSGGYLRTARRIASLFLEKGQVIVTTRARGEEKERYSADGTKMTDVPMVVLVDDGSASASEILAGALQDHKRAVVIGDKTYGKGSVQDIKELDSTGRKTAARITIAKWYLPGGASVEKDDPKLSGVEPSIKVTPAERDLWKEAAFDELRQDGRIQDHVAKSFDANKEAYRQLSETDGGDPSRYPGFDALYDSLGTKLSKVETIELVREFVRKAVQDDQGAALPLDFQTDVVLQRGIVEVAGKAGIDVKAIREYDVFAKAEKK